MPDIKKIELFLRAAIDDTADVRTCSSQCPTSAINMAGALRRFWRAYSSVVDSSHWLSRGLNFKCTKCGKCCTGGRERVVWVSDQEANAIAGSLGLDSGLFADRYLQAGAVQPAGSRLPLRKNSTNTACIFLVGGKCSIYEHRPTQCRTYPFWPEPLTSSHDWEAEALRCEGIQLHSSTLPHHHRQSYSNSHTLHSEVPVTSETQDDEPGLSPQASNADAYDARSAFSSPAQSPGSEISNAAVPLAVIKKQLVLEEISRSGEMGGITYDDMDELLTSVSPELVEEFSDDFFAHRGRKILHDSRRCRVLDTWNGDPPEHSRSLVLKACPSYAQTEVQLRQQPDGSMAVQHGMLCQPAHKAMCLAFALQAMSQRHMHCTAASSLHKPISVHDAPSLQPSSELAVAIIGAGACALPMAIHHHFPRATIDAVDIDAEALDLAQCFFGAQEDAHLLMHNDDGAKFLIRPGVASKFDVIMLDVAAPDPMGDPGSLHSIPAQFLAADFIQNGLRRRLRPGGVVAINILGGMPAVRQAVAALNPHFQHVHVLCNPEASVLFGRAALGSDSEASPARTALWRVTAAASAMKPLSVLCDELLSEQLEQWAVNDALHELLKSEIGYGWFTAQELKQTESSGQILAI